MENDLELAELQREVAVLRESLQSRALEIENIGWTALSGYTQQDDGLDLDTLKTLSDKLRELAATNPLHIRGAQLRHSYVFGRGVGYQDLKPAAKRIIDDPHNKAVMFSIGAYETNNLALFTDGNFQVIYNTTTRRFTAVPIVEVTGVITDPDDNSVLQYIQRSWSSNGEARKVWYPLARFKNQSGTRLPLTISAGGGAPAVPVAQDAVVYSKQSRKQTGWTWGIPDSLGAMIWTLTYTGYLSDNAKLVNALSKFAWTLTRNSAGGVAKAAAEVKKPGIGGTAIGDPGTAISSVGVPSAQVDFNHGQPLAALVATSMGVPVIALLSSPGATGGSYGAATTLDAPTIQGFEAVQDGWASFYEEILHDLGSPKATVAFPAIQNDPNYRQITSIELGRAGGVIWDDEARQAYLDILDLQKLHDTLPPKPDPALAADGSGVSAQGKQGAVPGGTDQGVSNPDVDKERQDNNK